MLRPLSGALLFGTTVALAQACGSDDATFEPTSAATGTGGTMLDGSSATGLGGGLGGGCTPACEPGTFCSGAEKCIPDGTCADVGDCGDGLTCDLEKAQCVPGGMCGSQEVKIEPIAPNLLVVLDRSCSMTAKVGGKAKWTIAVEALNALLTNYKDTIRFGITLFPDKVATSCAQDKIPYSPAPGNEPAIAALLTKSLDTNDPLYPSGPCVTNIDTAMLQAASEPALADPSRASYVMLVTDGAQSQSCMDGGGDMGTEKTIANLLGAEVKTFVIGFGGTGIDKAALNAFANAGGTPVNNGDIDYYDAADAASLDKAFADIATATLGCSFKLDKPVADPSKLFVFFDNDPKGVPRDPNHAEGWDYDPATGTVTFYGMACANLKTAVVKDVDIVFGCEAPSPG